MTQLRPIIIALTTASLMAQGQPDSTATADTWDYWLDPIVVTATRSERSIFSVPYAVHLIDQDNIQRGEVGLSLGEALDALPGIVVSNRHNLAQGDRISIRGIGSRAPFGVRGIKIYQDGIPLTMPDGQAQLNNMDLGSTGRIEILLGASSSLYGNAAGGVIHMHTQTAPDAPLRFEPRLIAGSYGLRKWQGKFFGKIGRQSYLVNVNRFAMDGFRDHSSARSTAVNVVGRRAISDHFRLVTVFNYYDAPYLLNPSSLTRAAADTLPTGARFFVRQQGSGKRVRQGQGGITLDYSGGHGRRFKATIHGLSRSLLNVIPGRIIDLERVAGGLRTVFRQDLQVGQWPLRWVLGADVELQQDARLEFTNQGLPDDQVDQVATGDMFDRLQYGPREMDQDERIYGLGPFTQLEVSLSPKWLLTVGERYDRYTFKASDHFLDDGLDDSGTRVMERLSPMAGIVYRPYELMKVYGTFSTAFQTPTTNELSNRPGGAGGFNPDLKPERIRSYEAGMKGVWHPWRLSYDLAFYHLAIADMLIPYQIQDPGTEEVFFRNAGRTRNRGGELKLDWSPLGGLRTTLAYTWMDFRFDDFLVESAAGDSVQLAGNAVPGVPPQTLFARLTYEHATGSYGELNLQWMDRTFANDFNGPAPGSDEPLEDFVNDAYVTIDLRLGLVGQLRRLGFELFMGVNNLLDERYNGSIVPNAFGNRFFEPAPGRSWYGGIQMSLPGAL